MRLCAAALAGVEPGITRPRYDRGTTGCGIVHLGVGAFHRAHQAVYTDAVLNQADGDWMILGASLKTTRAGSELNPQNGLYCLRSQDDQQETLQVVGSIKEVISASTDPAALISAIAAPATRIISLTITEKGYCRDPASGALRSQDPEVQHDLRHPNQPRSALGFLSAGLQHRRLAGESGLSILSCDNIPANGEAVRQVLMEFCELADPSMISWIERHVSFPATMVDRIVPAVTEDTRRRTENLLGLRDEAAVLTEPFCQWVIEDNFCQQRPAWNLAGAIFTDSVAPFETMKLRLLNGAHSAIAYLGHLGGHTFVAECVKDQQLERFIRDMMISEIAPTVTVPPGFELEPYIDQLIHRFHNSKLEHRCLQIAMDGSQKLPQRQLQTIADRLAAGQDFSHLALAVAAWMVFVTGRDLHGNPHSVDDPMATILEAHAGRFARRPGELVDSLLQLESIFTARLSQSKPLRQLLVEQVTGLYELGLAGALQRLQAAG